MKRKNVVMPLFSLTVTLFFILVSMPVFAQMATPDPVCTELASDIPHVSTASVRTDGIYFRSEDGRYVLLRGVNATGDAKVPPFKKITSPALLDPLPGWGINTIRLLFTWEAFEPTPCGFDTSYLDYYEQVVKWAAERDIYVIVDFHQDAFSRYALDGCGEGAPRWALTDKVSPAIPDNGERCIGWGTKATFSQQNYLVFERFFKNDKQALSHYLSMLRRVSARLSKYPNVIAYDMMNEPWSNAAMLNAFYARAGEIIRQSHPSAMLFFAPEVPPMGPLVPISTSAIVLPLLGNVVLAPHYYSGALFTLKVWPGGDTGNVLDQWKKKTDNWNIPMFLGEFGAPPDVVNVSAYMESQYRWLDKNLVSATQWSYTPGWTAQNKDGWNMEDLSIVDDNMQLRSAIFRPRPYPQKTAGKPIAFERHANGFTYTWQNDPSLGDGRTEFYIPADYSAGKAWKADPALSGLSCAAIHPHRISCKSLYRGKITVSLKR